MQKAGEPSPAIAKSTKCFVNELLLGQKIGHHGLLLFQLIHRRVNFRAAEFVDLDALNNLPLRAVAADGEGTDQALLDPVAAVRAHAHAVPVIGRRGVHEGRHGIHRCVGRAGRAGGTTRLDDGRAALLHGGQELALEPRLVGDDLRGGLPVDLGAVKVRILRGGVVAPDRHLADGGRGHTGLLGQLRFRAVLIQTRHGEPAIRRNRRSVVHGDHAVGVAGISHHEHAHIAGGILRNRIALANEDFAVDAQQILALHSLLAGNAAHQERPIHILKSFIKAGGGHNALEKRKSAIVQFHHHSLESGQCGFDFDQMKNNRLVWAEHGAGSDPEQQRITNLTGSTGHRDTNGTQAHTFILF